LPDKVDIQATITEVKLNEFNQSKLVFLEGLEDVEGYIGYTESPGEKYSISIEWKSRPQLDSFLKSELFHFFKGAIHTLGKLIHVSIKHRKDNE
jgi:hypothetical protein